MRGGIWVLNIFAAIWGAGGIVVGHGPAWLTAVPIVISALLLLWARRQPVGTGNPVEGDHVGRIVAIATGLEGVAIFVVANVLVNLDMPTALLPVVAVIVGLHFLPLARWIPVRLYYGTGAGLIAVGLGALLLAPPHRAAATGIAAAMVLWASGITLVRRGRG